MKKKKRVDDIEAERVKIAEEERRLAVAEMEAQYQKTQKLQAEEKQKLLAEEKEKQKLLAEEKEKQKLLAEEKEKQKLQDDEKKKQDDSNEPRAEDDIETDIDDDDEREAKHSTPEKQPAKITQVGCTSDSTLPMDEVRPTTASVALGRQTDKESPVVSLLAPQDADDCAQTQLQQTCFMTPTRKANPKPLSRRIIPVSSPSVDLSADRETSLLRRIQEKRAEINNMRNERKKLIEICDETHKKQLVLGERIALVEKEENDLILFG